MKWKEFGLGITTSPNRGHSELVPDRHLLSHHHLNKETQELQIPGRSRHSLQSHPIERERVLLSTSNPRLWWISRHQSAVLRLGAGTLGGNAFGNVGKYITQSCWELKPEMLKGKREISNFRLDAVTANDSYDVR